MEEAFEPKVDDDDLRADFPETDITSEPKARIARITHIAQVHGIQQQQYADDTQLYLSLIHI